MGIPATTALLTSPNAIAVADDGTIYFSQTNNDRIRKIDPKGILTYLDYDAKNGTRLASVSQIAVGPNNELYLVDRPIANGPSRISTLSSTDSSVGLVLETIFGGTPDSTSTRDCGMGKIVNQAASTIELNQKIQTSLSTIYNGSEIHALTASNTCSAADPAARKFSLLFSQSFGKFSAAGSNIIQIEKPCTK